jgi:hypothetical protein
MTIAVPQDSIPKSNTKKGQNVSLSQFTDYAAVELRITNITQ